MTETRKDGNGNPAAAGAQTDDQKRQFALQRLYLKDMSFETPNAPEIFKAVTGDPDVNLNLRNAHSELGDDAYEVVLHLSVHAKVEDRSLFLVELDQAGIFIIKGYTEAERKQLLGTYCPTTLFPYAREAISGTVSKGGFPPLVLQPINFDALYAQAAASATQTEN